MSGHHLGINMGHDRSVAVVKDGRVVVAIEQERLDRIKHSVGFMLQAPHATGLIQVPGESIAYCLDHLGLSLGDMETITANMPGADKAPQIMRGKFSADLASKLRVVPSHHLAHAYSAFWPSGFDEALVLVVDASGSMVEGPEGRRTESYTLYAGRGEQLQVLHSETVQSHLAGLATLGFVYEEVTRRAGFVTRLNLGLSFPEAGKLMGLAAYGGPQPHWEPWLSKTPGSSEIQICAYDIFLEMAALEKRYDDGEGPAHFRPWLVDLAYKVQAELEQVLCDLLRDASKETGLDKVCIAGGVGLNSVANYKILRECDLDDIFIFPAAADNGIAVGCALWAYHAEGGGTERPPMDTACLGRAYGEQEVEAALSQHFDLLEVEQLEPDEMGRRVAEALTQGHIVARFEGGAEFGPRALGHRSILADPTFERMKDVVNARVKFREAFRPFAPVVPLERAEEVFDLAVSSPYMLLVAPVREELREKLPAITHEDGTGRVQTCTPDQAPFLHALCVEAARIRGGTPVLLNTSFNVAGQPIVETPIEAVETFLRTDIDYLALEDRWIRRRHQPVKDYEEHVRGLEVETRPKGLSPNQPSVRSLMEDLDAAIFQGRPSLNWSEDEVTALSAAGARYKQTSRLFPDSALLAPLETQLAPNADLLIDPRASSLLVDPSERRGEEALDMSRLQAVLAMRHEPSALREELRLRLQATPAELDDLIVEMAGVLGRFEVPFHPGWWAAEISAPPEAVLPESGKTVGAFEDANFRLDEPLARVRRAILRHGYTESSIRDILKVESLQQIEPTHLHYYDVRLLPQTPLADLIRLFLLRAAVPRDRVERIFAAEELRCLQGLGLITEEDDRLYGAVDLFCTGGLLVATDHRHMIRAGDRMDEDPVMYIGMDSHGLVQTAPRSECERVLDLCCGSGVQGLAASRYARAVVAVDLNPRAVRFARFNAQLNGISNFAAHLGDLYDAVDGQRFDCILANPPFVPSPEDSLKFRDGGASGERLLRTIVQEADAHLTDAGRLCVVTDLVDTSVYRLKLRHWLGGASAYGLILTTADRDEVLFSVPHCHAPFNQSLDDYNAELERWVDNFRSADLKAVNFGYILVWKREQGHGCDITKRTLHNPSSPIWTEVQDWHNQRRAWDAPNAGLAILSLHPRLRMVTEESPEGGDRHCELRIPESAFFTTYTVSPFIADELRRIHRTQPELSRRLVDQDAEWVERLHRLGVLKLIGARQEIAPQPVPESGGAARSVDEHPTKTTPTCLTSYLR